MKTEAFFLVIQLAEKPDLIGPCLWQNLTWINVTKLDLKLFMAFIPLNMKIGMFCCRNTFDYSILSHDWSDLAAAAAAAAAAEFAFLREKYIVVYISIYQGATLSRKLPCWMSWGASRVTLVVKKPPASAGKETRIWSLGREDPLEEGLATTLQYSCLENPMDRGSWQATVQSHRVGCIWSIWTCYLLSASSWFTLMQSWLSSFPRISRTIVTCMNDGE